MISSYATLPAGPGPHCASGYTLFPTDNAHKAALQFNRFHCYNAATIAAMDTRMAKEYASGIQSAATLFQDWALNAGPGATHPHWRTIIADMDGDNRADLLDQWLPDGRLWRHLNKPAAGAAVFESAFVEMSSGYNPAAGGSWTTMIGDFDGDGRADFADLLYPGGNIGYFWKHRNEGTYFGPDYGPRVDTSGAPNWRMIGVKD